jgi:transcription elongation factor Elf1
MWYHNLEKKTYWCINEISKRFLTMTVIVSMEVRALPKLRPALSERYAHTLLFNCPDCDLPVSIACISQDKNLEQVASQTFRLHCSYCGKRSAMPGVAAKMHWVSDWFTP